MIIVHSAIDSDSASSNGRGSGRGSVSRVLADRCGSWISEWNDTMLASLFEHADYLRKRRIEKKRKEKKIGGETT